MKWLYGLDKLHRVSSSSARQALLRGAVEYGAAGFDVAPMYGNGMGEIELGRFVLAVGSIKREQLEINTKFGIPYLPYGVLPGHFFAGARVADLVFRKIFKRSEQRDFSKSALIRSVDTSLTRLKTNYIDTLFFHEPCTVLENCDEMKESLNDLRISGKVRRFGVCGQYTSVFDMAFQIGADVVQAPLSSWRDAPVLVAERGVYHIRRDFAFSPREPLTLSGYASAANSVRGSYVLFQSTQMAHLKSFAGV